MNFSKLNSFLNWSTPVGKLFGIPIRLHISILFFLWPILSARQMGIVFMSEYVVGIVLSILLHELGHALTAKKFGLTGLSIMLHGFGGFAVSSGYRTPRQALIISLMGPAVTFVLGFLLIAIGKPMYAASESDLAWIVYSLGKLNILLGCLNLIPSLPFDGGQSLVAILNHRMTNFHATRIVGHVGLVFCSLLLILSFFIDRNLLFIFALMGLISSVMYLMNSGGVRFSEITAERRARKAREEIRKREQAKTNEFLSNVKDREKERQERERLRKLFEGD